MFSMLTQNNCKYKCKLEKIFLFTNKCYFQGNKFEESGIYGSHSPKRNISGPIILPQGDRNGCEDAVYVNVVNYSVPWIALVARGKCTFAMKINQVNTIPCFSLHCFWLSSMNL